MCRNYVSNGKLVQEVGAGLWAGNNFSNGNLVQAGDAGW